MGREKERKYMALKQIYGKTYYADFTDANGHRRRVSLQTTNLKVAQLKYGEIIHRRNTVKEKVVVDISWQAFKDRLYKFMKAERSENTTRRTRIAIEHLEAVQMPKNLADVTPALVQQVKERLIDMNMGKHNINRLVQCLKAMMRHAEKWGLVPKQEWSGISKLKTPKGRVVFHTVEEIKQLLAACPSEGWRLVVLLGADAGLRRGEMANLQWQDVDFEHNQMYIAPDKTENHRFVPMSRGLRKALERAKIGAKGPYVVNVGQERCRKSKDFLTAYYKKIAKKANLKSFIHKLRHTFASLLVQDGVDLYTVSKLLGHSSIKMTEIYAHLAPDTLQAAVAGIVDKEAE